jgi:hypothetical protein
MFIEAFKHPSYLRVGDRPVLKIHSGHYVLKNAGDDPNHLRERIRRLRNLAREAGLGEIIIGIGTYYDDPLIHQPWFRKIFDYASYYMAVPPVEPKETDYSYDVLADYTRALRLFHASTDIPFVPHLAAGWNPRPWKDPRPRFELPDRHQWKNALTLMRADLELYPNLGFPTPTGRRKAFTIYAWNEFGEGGFIAPTKAASNNKLSAIKEMFPD